MSSVEKMNHQDTKTPRKDLGANEERIATAIVDAAIKVHSVLGPGLLESVYEACMVYELRSRGHQIETQVVLPIHYEEMKVESGLRLALRVDGLAIVELKAVEKVLPVHEAQLLTYLKLAGLRLGLLLNFNVPLMKDGIQRRVR